MYLDTGTVFRDKKYLGTDKNNQPENTICR